MVTRYKDDGIRTGINEGTIKAVFVHEQITRLHMTLFPGERKEQTR